MRKKKKDYIIVPSNSLSREERETAIMAAQLKAAFAAKWQAVYKRPYRKIERADNQKIWLAAAETVRRLGGTAEGFVEAQFALAKSICIPTRLSGPTAEKRYRAYLISKGLETTPVAAAWVDKDARIDPGSAELKELSTAHTSYIKNAYGIDDVNDPVHLKIVLASPWLFDPLGACLVLGDHPEIIKTFRLGAAARLREYPYLQDAMARQGMQHILTSILTE